MKKKFNLITFFSLCAIVASAQFTVNGNMNESGYKTTVTKSNANLCFGSAIDITAIKIGKDASNIYIGVVCKMDPTGSNDGIAVWLNFSNVTGTSAGTNMTLAGAGHYMASNFAADFEVDYLFALNPGGTATECYVDAMRRVGTPLSAYLDNCGQAGISIAGSRGGTTPNFVFSAPGIEFAFLGTGIATSGFEIKIPFTAVEIGRAHV